ncbi:MAG: CinA family nicotinamide mononucleotide deamidase-related protein [Gammaproteobacteria bacterium]|nr:MAG: CinA family nicotinamide mononucleotide deamidase-related protein [Gammaproteobacteria bacterium]
MNIQLLMTGNELMSGVTVDSNSAMIAQALSPLGLAVHARSTIGDDKGLLVSELQRLATTADVLIVNGGLGPTVDDLTAEALAKAAGLPLAEHPDALTHVTQWLATRGVPLNAANRKQAMLPADCELVDNPVGSAPGFRLMLGQCLVICTPGVPSELRRMLADSIIPLLQSRFPGIEPVLETRLHVFGMGESGIQQLLNDTFPEWPDAIELGFRAGLPTLEVKLRSHGHASRHLHEQWKQKVLSVIGDHVVAEGDDSIAKAFVRLLTERQLTVTTAESCTGGLMAAMITEVPGASAMFEAGFVTYSNAMKTELLGVDPMTLEKEGAVSESVVRQMAEGALAHSSADYAVAVSGIAGPDGGTEAKPAGTVWIAWGKRGDIKTRCLLFPLGRRNFQSLVAALGLDVIRRDIMGIISEPRYFRERKGKA